MKNTIKNILVLSFILFVSNFTLRAQNCIQCDGSSITGSNASAVGSNNTASGSNSFAGGYLSQAKGSNSFAFGYKSTANQSTTAAIGNTAEAIGVGSMAIGTYVKATTKNALAFGCGTTTNYPLTNSTPYSIAFGVNSNIPTMLITKALNNNYTGKVAIGNITSPEAKLHIKSDENEEASVFIEPSDKNNQQATIRLFDNNHSITVDQTEAMKINAKTGPLNFMGTHYCFGKSSEKKVRLYSNENPALYFNVIRTDIESKEKAGSAYALDFQEDAIRFRTSKKQNQAGSEITNWKSNLFLCTDGKIGIGSKETFLENNDNLLVIHSPNNMDLQSTNITLSGKIGINTTNNTDDYALAVDGGIVSTKVYIKEVSQWPDHVFSENYKPLSLSELKEYVLENKHLPGIPSEDEVVKNGYDLHEMQYLLLEKIEELTQYILLLQEEINVLSNYRTDSIQFSYDANGNRISRSLIIEKAPNPGMNSPTQNDICEVFPNPTPGMFSVVLKEQVATAKPHARLLNATGVVLKEQDLVHQTSTFDLSAHPSGIYILEIDSSEEIQIWKIIKN